MMLMNIVTAPISILNGKPIYFLPVILLLLSIILTSCSFPAFCGTPDSVPVLVDEERSFWEDVLLDSTINNKNLFYAGYIAYKDRLCDLSIESFKECIKSNPANSLVKGISAYYIGKSLFLLGKYTDAIEQFSYVLTQDLNKFDHLKLAALVNTAVTYHRMNDMARFRETLQKVIKSDTEGKYRRIAEEMLSL
jgi:tetratricopeptide (TPR) repeat protein